MTSNNILNKFKINHYDLLFFILFKTELFMKFSNGNPSRIFCASRLMWSFSILAPTSTLLLSSFDSEQLSLGTESGTTRFYHLKSSRK